MGSLIATLSMYDWPETRATLDRFWHLIREELESANLPAPVTLQHVDSQMPLWTSSDLVVGQTCGWPYANQLREMVTPFARFDYGLENCEPGTYQSIYVGQSAEDVRYLENASTLSQCPAIAMNMDDSQSGFHVFSEISGKPASDTISERQRLVTGAHRNSIRAVADGKARIAAIDAVAFNLAKRYDPEVVNAVQIIGYSSPKPGLPLITSPQHASLSHELYQAISAGHSKLSDDEVETLMIKSVLPAEDKEYEVFLARSQDQV